MALLETLGFLAVCGVIILGGVWISQNVQIKPRQEKK